MKSAVSNGVKYRKHANDEFYTPRALARSLIPLVPISPGDLLLDPAPGPGAFYDQLPGNRMKTPDFFAFDGRCDWAITNPPYSKLDAWFEQSTKVCEKGFAYLLGLHNITPRRLEMCERAGFGLTTVHLCKVYQWFGMSAFVVFERGKPSIIKFDRKVWHPE